MTRSARIGIHVRPQDFEEFKKMLPGEKRFATTYAHWLDESIKGPPPRKVVTVDPREFSLYCLQIGQPASVYTLQAFAVKKARDEDEGRPKT